MAKELLKDIPFAAGVVGSLPRPQHLIDMLPDIPGQESIEMTTSSQMDRAIAYAITVQESAGLDQVSDGEWRRHAYTHIIADIAHGFTSDNRVDPHRWGITITEPMVVHSPGIAAREAGFLVKKTDLMTKVCIPSPYLLGERLWEKQWSSKAYPTRNNFIDALVPILRNELLELVKTGVTVVQIDEPHLGVLVDPKIRGQFENPVYEMDLAADKINELIHGVEGIRLALHLCRRNWGRSGWGADGGYEPIVNTMKKIKVDQYVMEFSIPAAGDFSILKEMPDDSLIGLGCVDCRFETIEKPMTIVSRVEEAMKYVDSGRISLNPDCGFSPGKASYSSLDEAYNKLKNEAEAARILRDKYT